MLIEKPLPFVTTFIEALDDAIKIHQPGSELFRTQKHWLSFCVMAILITNSVCWARFERASIGKYSMAALSWMFHHSKIPWDLLLHLSIRVVLLKSGCHPEKETRSARQSPHNSANFGGQHFVTSQKVCGRYKNL